MFNNRREQGGKIGAMAGFLLATVQMIADGGIKKNPELAPLVLMAYITFTGGGYIIGSAAGYALGEAESAYNNFFSSPSSHKP